MDLKFQDPGLAYNVESARMFLYSGQGPQWREAFCFFYPQIDRKKLEEPQCEAQEAYLGEALAGVYQEVREEIARKAEAYQACWQACAGEIEAAFSDAFSMEVRPLFNDITACITLNPVSPRFLAEHRFDVFFRNSDRGALGVSLHELTHFLWFHKWREIFQDDPAQYETPALQWILSEMAVHAVLGEERLAALNPYYPNECVYECFYRMKIEGRPILEWLGEQYRAMPVEIFMKESYAFCLRHEEEIRRQMF